MNENERGFYKVIDDLDGDIAVNTPAGSLLENEWYKDDNWDRDRCVDFRTVEAWPDSNTVQHKNMQYSLPVGCIYHHASDDPRYRSQYSRMRDAISKGTVYPKVLVFTNYSVIDEQLRWYWCAYTSEILPLIKIMVDAMRGDMAAVRELGDCGIHQDVTPKLESGNWFYNRPQRRFIFRWEVAQLWGCNIYTPPTVLFEQQPRLF